MSTTMGSDRRVGEFYARLGPLCVASLRRAWNPQTGVFDRQLRDGCWEGTLGTEDLTSTCIVLIGLHRAGVEPGEVGIDASDVLEAMKRLAIRRRYFGGLGLVLWANAVWGGEPAGELLKRLSLSEAAVRGQMGGNTTMQAAWLVSGLLHEVGRHGGRGPTDLVRITYEELRRRYRPTTRVMAHATAAGRWGVRVRQNVANFADQIYSAQAFAFTRLVLGDAEAGQASAAVAGRMVELQGEKGQWWWHYDPRDGKVAQHYSVYSVHQHGMAPFALAAVRATGGGDFSAAADRGRAWLGDNELGMDMVDEQAETVWRSIDDDIGAMRAKLRNVRVLLGVKGETPGALPLRLNCETRPYEWAWCLYAGAVETGEGRSPHLV